VVAFLHDARTPGGRLELPPGTSFIILGDLNLVGDRQQLKTLLEGDIQNKSTFGEGGMPDWDDTPLADLVSYHTDAPAAYTWRNPNETFLPGRLDFMIYTGSAMEVRKSFVLNTESMSPARLARYTLDKTDTELSDHLPKVADFALINTVTGKREPVAPTNVAIYPNPLTDQLTLEIQGEAVILVYNMNGQKVMEATGIDTIMLNTTGLMQGVYFIKIITGKKVVTHKILKK
jgi:hypothetical protein